MKKLELFQLTSPRRRRKLHISEVRFRFMELSSTTERDDMSYVTAHVLDATAGIPAPGVSITLLTGEGDVVASATTNDDGRVPELGPDLLDAGDYRIEFGTGAYFASRGQATIARPPRRGRFPATRRRGRGAAEERERPA